MGLDMRELQNIIISPIMDGAVVVEKNPLVALILDSGVVNMAEKMVLGRFKKIKGSSQDPKIILNHSFEAGSPTSFSDPKKYLFPRGLASYNEDKEFPALWSCAYVGSEEIIQKLSERKDWTKAYVSMIKYEKKK